MQSRTSKAVALLGGVATLALGSTFMLRLSAPKTRQLQTPCAPRMLELERSVCTPPLAVPHPDALAQLSVHTH